MSTIYNVKNRSAGTVCYKIPEMGVRRSFAPGEIKKISADELEKLTYRAGGMKILANYLQIMDQAGLESVGLRVEPEYNMSEQDIVKMLKTGSLDEFLDCLDFAPVGVIDLIKSLSVRLPLTDFNKRQALKTKTGFDVDAALKHMMEDKDDEKTVAAAPAQRRVQKEDLPAGRRTTPKYNIISQAPATTEAE